MRIPVLPLVTIATAIWTSTAAAFAQTVTSERHAFRVATLVAGLEHPWGLAFLPNGDLLITERPGRLRLVRDGVLDPNPVPGAPKVAASGV